MTAMASTSRSEHLTVANAGMSVRDARDRYLDENDFTMAGYTEEHSTFDFFGLSIVIKNSEGRKRGLPFHDLHHVALGFGTDLAGECEVSAFELRSGVRGYGLLVRLLVLEGFLLGLVIAPLRTLRAWRAASGRTSLFRDPLPIAVALEMTVGQLRDHLRIPEKGLFEVAPKRHHGKKPGAV